jgi:DinB superfamily
MTDSDAALGSFAALDEAALGRPWSFRDKPMDVRFALYRTLEDAQEVMVAIAARSHPESRRILALAQRAFGDLRGLLIGLPVDLLDRSPREGEWSIGEVLHHVLAIERRYAIQTRYAVERADGDPMRIPDGRLPPTAPLDVPGGVGELLARIGEARAETNRWLGSLASAMMTRPTQWVHYDVDVRFRLHRFAAHLIEHTIQCEKTLAALDWRPTEGRRVVRRLSAVLGEIEGLGGLAEAREIETRLIDRFASTTAA